MCAEPSLQPLDSEHFKYKNTEAGAWLDVANECFWGCRQNDFFDVRVINYFPSISLQCFDLLVLPSHCQPYEHGMSMMRHISFLKM